MAQARTPLRMQGRPNRSRLSRALPFALVALVGAALAAAYPALRSGPAKGTIADETVRADAIPEVRVGGSAVRPAGIQPDVARADAVRTDTAGLEVAEAGAIRTDLEARPALAIAVEVVRGRGAGEAVRAEQPAAPAAAEPETVSGLTYTLCRQTPYVDCVVDGDTFHLGRRAIRIADIDAPEIHDPECLRESELGTRATYRLLALLNAGAFVLTPGDGPDEDDYGRQLRFATRDGRSIGGILVAEGLARTWDGPDVQWCP